MKRLNRLEEAVEKEGDVFIVKFPLFDENYKLLLDKGEISQRVYNHLRRRVLYYE